MCIPDCIVVDMANILAIIMATYDGGMAFEVYNGI